MSAAFLPSGYASKIVAKQIPSNRPIRPIASTPSRLVTGNALYKDMRLADLQKKAPYGWEAEARKSGESKYKLFSSMLYCFGYDKTQLHQKYGIPSYAPTISVLSSRVAYWSYDGWTRKAHPFSPGEFDTGPIFYFSRDGKVNRIHLGNNFGYFGTSVGQLLRFFGVSPKEAVRNTWVDPSKMYTLANYEAAGVRPKTYWNGGGVVYIQILVPSKDGTGKPFEVSIAAEVRSSSVKKYDRFDVQASRYISSYKRKQGFDFESYIKEALPFEIYSSGKQKDESSGTATSSGTLEKLLGIGD